MVKVITQFSLGTQFFPKKGSKELFPKKPKGQTWLVIIQDTPNNLRDILNRRIDDLGDYRDTNPKGRNTNIKHPKIKEDNPSQDDKDSKIEIVYQPTSKPILHNKESIIRNSSRYRNSHLGHLFRVEMIIDKISNRLIII